MSVDTMHLKDPLFIFDSEGALPLFSPPFFFLPEKLLRCHCSLRITTKDRVLDEKKLWH